ncbi:ArsR/SmtB family transcription factor [Actinoplanes derwentensis]|uniref:DNA-binding transcriptional regulator, ArsR family n=1 Tax=Actinoplanes derwentensis TaxID=113562 RepID=A0A1H1Z8G6_9ACTN|nr:metalloregulator ArsR/SmtB family transcription factor [Actinoplanes derwentensis]SDT29486.1 DNA-binding transcriptional regulator, ArsR family [Actinoplanes derwentensis]
MAGDMDKVFKALADPTRRRLLDDLRAETGQTLGRLCARLAMTRQSVTQHLGVLEEANLVSSVRRGRERLHYLNPVPLQDVRNRWIASFEEPRLRVLDTIRREAEQPRRQKEDSSMRPDYVYVTYIHATPERVWETLLSADLTGDFWGHRNVSDWRPGSPWEHVRIDGSGVADAGGVVLEVEPPDRLVMTFGEPGAVPGPESSVVTFLIERYQDIVRLTVTHANLQSDDDVTAISFGWPAVMANLKSLLETGQVLPQAPWEMHADLPG